MMQNLGLLWQNGSLIGMGILLFFVACGPTSEGKAPLVAPAPSCTPSPPSTQTVAPVDEAREARLRTKFPSLFEGECLNRTPANGTTVATPTPDWTLEKIKRDRLAEQLLIEAYVLAEAQEGGLLYPNLLVEVIESFVPVYMAIACVEGSQPSVEGFRTYIGDDVPSGFAEESAKRVIQAIDAAHDKWQDQSLDPATQHCLQPYLQPKSLSEAAPAVDLYTLWVIRKGSPFFREGTKRIINRRAAQWFSRPNPDRNFLTWLCRYSDEYSSDYSCGLDPGAL